MADLFALGVMLFIIATKAYPFEIEEDEVGIEIPENYKTFLYKNDKFWKTFDKYIKHMPNNEMFKDLINKMLAYDLS
jgi:serine/threonine protein kinase